MYLKLTTQINSQGRKGIAIGTLDVDLKLGDGTIVSLPIPYLPVNTPLAIVPVIDARGTTVLFNMSRWIPAHMEINNSGLFPVSFPSQEQAVTVGRVFAADTNTAWNDPDDQKRAWLHSNATKLDITLDQNGNPT